MTFDQLKSLNPCRAGLGFALKFASVKEAWLNCNNNSNLLWFAARSAKRPDLIILFAEECAGRALTYAAAAAAAASAAYAAVDAAAAAVYAADYADAAAVVYAAAYAADAAADAAAAVYPAAEREVQRERIYELFTDIIFPPN